nr:hypothetical protein BaRGS_033118 [Batillaria attramentaria]
MFMKIHKYKLKVAHCDSYPDCDRATGCHTTSKRQFRFGSSNVRNTTTIIIIIIIIVAVVVAVIIIIIIITIDDEDVNSFSTTIYKHKHAWHFL